MHEIYVEYPSPFNGETDEQLVRAAGTQPSGSGCGLAPGWGGRDMQFAFADADVAHAAYERLQSLTEQIPGLQVSGPSATQ